MSHTIFGGLHGADLVSAEDKKATCKNMFHVTDAAENRWQSTHAPPGPGWHISSFKRQTCPVTKLLPIFEHQNLIGNYMPYFRPQFNSTNMQLYLKNPFQMSPFPTAEDLSVSLQ